MPGAEGRKKQRVRSRVQGLCRALPGSKVGTPWKVLSRGKVLWVLTASSWLLSQASNRKVVALISVVGMLRGWMFGYI